MRDRLSLLQSFVQPHEALVTSYRCKVSSQPHCQHQLCDYTSIIHTYINCIKNVTVSFVLSIAVSWRLDAVISKSRVGF